MKKINAIRELKAISALFLFFLVLSSVHAQDTNSDANGLTQLVQTSTQNEIKLSDTLQQASSDVIQVKETFTNIILTGVMFLEKLVNLLVINPIAVIGLILEIAGITFLIEMIAGGWGFKHWMQVIGAVIGVITYPFILNWLIVPLLKTVGL